MTSVDVAFTWGILWGAILLVLAILCWKIIVGIWQSFRLKRYDRLREIQREKQMIKNQETDIHNLKSQYELMFHENRSIREALKGAGL